MVVKVDLKRDNTLVLNSSFENVRYGKYKKIYLIIRYRQFNLRI